MKEELDMPYDLPSNKHYKNTERLRKLCTNLLFEISSMDYDTTLLFSEKQTPESQIHCLIFQHNMELIFHKQAIQDFLLSRVTGYKDHATLRYDFSDNYDEFDDILNAFQQYIFLPLTYNRANLVSILPSMITGSEKEIHFILTILFKTFFISLLNQFDQDITECIRALCNTIHSDKDFYQKNRYPENGLAISSAINAITHGGDWYIKRVGKCLQNISIMENYCYYQDIQYLANTNFYLPNVDGDNSRKFTTEEFKLSIIPKIQKAMADKVLLIS